MTTQSTRSTPWLVPFKSNPQAELRLFCFPYAGGGAVIFRAWAESLPAAVEILPVELPGRGGRLKEKPLSNFSLLVGCLAQALSPYFNKPFAFFGHSMGAMLAFELIRKLRTDRGLMPVHLFVSGRRAPHLPNRDNITYDLPEHEFLDELRRLNGTPREVLEHPELMQLLLPILRADFEVFQTYEYSPAPPLSCSISAFGGLRDRDVSREQLAAWGDQTTAGFDLRMLPGGHFFLNTARPLLLQLLARDLNQLVRQTGPRAEGQSKR